MARRHIVIGGAGFLGLELVKELANISQRVVVIDIFASPEILTFFHAHNTSFFKCDISRPKALQNIDLGKEDIVHHLASKLIIPKKNRDLIVVNILLKHQFLEQNIFLIGCELQIAAILYFGARIWSMACRRQRL